MPSFLEKIFSRRPKLDKPPKIVGLMLARNEGAKVLYPLRTLAMHTDAIIFLDDCSTDDTLAQVESCRESCRIERVLTNTTWDRDEPTDRNRLLAAGREIGGTHFIMLDADEVLTANLLKGDFLKKKILSLAPGEHIILRWIHLWRNVDTYRTDGVKGDDRFKAFIFCDEGKATYPSGHITHTPRVPLRKGRRLKLKGPFGVLHFSHVNWGNLEVKMKWYQRMERVYYPEKTIDYIRERYQHNEDETGLVTKPCPADWYEGYPLLDRSIWEAPDAGRIRQIEEWEKEKGLEYFAGLP